MGVKDLVKVPDGTNFKHRNPELESCYIHTPNNAADSLAFHNSAFQNTLNILDCKINYYLTHIIHVHFYYLFNDLAVFVKSNDYKQRLEF